RTLGANAVRELVVGVLGRRAEPSVRVGRAVERPGHLERRRAGPRRRAGRARHVGLRRDRRGGRRDPQGIRKWKSGHEVCAAIRFLVGTDRWDDATPWDHGTWDDTAQLFTWAG